MVKQESKDDSLDVHSTEQTPSVEKIGENSANIETPSVASAKNGPTTSNSARRSRSRRKSKPKKRSAASAGREDDAETEELKSKLLKRGEKDDSRRSRGEIDRGPIVKRDSDGRVCPQEIVNPSTYDKLFTRLEETNFNKVSKPDGVHLDKTPWICCLCQRGPCVDDLGDLFGPYYAKLSPPTFWPPFVGKSTEQRKFSSASAGAGDVYADLWFHGDCLCWAPGILLRGWGMTGLEENLPKYWQQKCLKCHKVGASVTCHVKGCDQKLHFPCAIATGTAMKESDFSMYCDSHKKSADKKK